MGTLWFVIPASPLVLQESGDFIVCPTQVEDQHLAFALEHEAKIQPAPAFHERHNPAQANPGVKMGAPISENRRRHCRKYFGPTIGRNALEEAWGGREFHPTRSSTLRISRNVPARRA